MALRKATAEQTGRQMKGNTKDGTDWPSNADKDTQRDGLTRKVMNDETETKTTRGSMNFLLNCQPKGCPRRNRAFHWRPRARITERLTAGPSLDSVESARARAGTTPGPARPKPRTTNPDRKARRTHARWWIISSGYSRCVGGARKREGADLSETSSSLTVAVTPTSPFIIASSHLPTLPRRLLAWSWTPHPRLVFRLIVRTKDPDLLVLLVLCSPSPVG